MVGWLVGWGGVGGGVIVALDCFEGSELLGSPYMGGCQSYDPFWGTLNTKWCCIIIL